MATADARHRATPRLLVAIAETTEMTPARQYLVELLAGLSGVGVQIQVAATQDGVVCDALRTVADVRVLRQLGPRTASGLVQSAARRLGPGAADRVFDARAAADLAWLQRPDGIHLHGAAAATVLAYVRDPTIPVTTYVHPHDWSIAGLEPRDRARLVDRTRRFLIGDPGNDAERAAATEHLLAAGVDRARIEAAPPELAFPPAPLSRDEDRALRRSLDLPADAVVIGIGAVADWIDLPDLTLALAWELERDLGDAAPHLWWYGMPSDIRRRWPIEHDIDQLGLTHLHVTGELGGIDPVEVADVLVLPTGGDPVPATMLDAAAERATPVLCWSGHHHDATVRANGGTVVTNPDVAAMAALVAELTRSGAARYERGAPGWLQLMAPIERITPLAVPAPRGHR